MIMVSEAYKLPSNKSRLHLCAQVLNLGIHSTPSPMSHFVPESCEDWWVNLILLALLYDRWRIKGARGDGVAPLLASEFFQYVALQRNVSFSIVNGDIAFPWEWSKNGMVKIW